MTLRRGTRARLKSEEQEQRANRLPYIPGANAVSVKRLPGARLREPVKRTWERLLAQHGARQMVQRMRNGSCAVVSEPAELCTTHTWWLGPTLDPL
eukprot:1194397-Prorocentrum_minimum.AAC.9